MNAQPLVSVIMSVYNGEAFLREAVESIIHQTWTDFEFVIINDGSTDATPHILEEYRQKDARIRVIAQENHGLIASLNRGCGAASGRYLARMDADDIALPERLEKQTEYLEQHPDIAMLGSAIALTSTDGTIFSTMRYPLENDEIQETLYHHNNFAHSAMMMRKDVFEAIGGYRPTFVSAEDYDLWMRIAEQYKAGNLPDVLIHYRVHESGVSAKNICEQLTSSIAAQAASALRRAGRTDPAKGHLTPELLAELELPNTILGDRLADTMLNHAHFWMHKQSMEDAARYLFAAMQYVLQPFVHQRMVARMYRAFARYYQQKQDYGRSSFAVLCSWFVRLFDGRKFLYMLAAKLFLHVPKSKYAQPNA